MTKLKPCPFCGDTDITNDDIVWLGAYRQCWVQCARCGAHGPDWRGELAAIEAWNERIAPSTTDDVEEA